jgi:hypothetical protein
LFTGNLVVPEGRMTEMKNVCDFDKKEAFMEYLKLFFGYFIRKNK